MTRHPAPPRPGRRHALPALLALLLALAPAAPAPAQVSLALRAGDQARLSRLVLDLPPGLRWDMVQEGRTVTLRFPGVALDFDTSAIFPERRASRVLSARTRSEATGTVLQFTLACDCSAESFALGPRKLVVDISDSPAPPPPAPVAMADPMPPVPHLGGAPETAPQAVPRPAPMPAPDLRTEVPEEDRAAIAEARTRLMEKLARAAQQGLVEFRDPGLVAGTRADGDTGGDTGEDPGGDTPAEGDPAAEDLAGGAASPLAATTARDRDMEADRLTEAPPPVHCLPDAAFDLADWAGTDPVARQIAAARGALVSEFDRPDPEAVSRLVRLYIHYGFGLEAEDLIDNMGITIPRADLLRSLARLVEGRDLPVPSPLGDQQDCPGPAGVWGFLARIDPATGTLAPGTGTAPASQDLRLTFTDLPTVPRRLVGPPLALGLLELGRDGDARMILAMTGLAPGDPGDAYHFARARLFEAEGDPEEAERIYDALIAENRSNAAAAMVALTENRLQRGLRPPATLPDDLAGAAMIQRDTAEGARLQAAEIAARAAAGELERALALLSRQVAQQPERVGELQAEAARLLARADPEEIGTAAYAAAVIAHRGLLARGPSADPARLIIAGALTGLGLPNVALDILAPTLGRNGPEARLAAAQAHLRLDEATAARAMVEGLEGSEPARIRAMARSRVGDYAGAAAELDPAEDPARRGSLAFAAGDWQGALESGNPVERTMAAYMSGLGPELAPLPEGTDPAEEEVLRAFLTPTPDLSAEISLAGAREALALARSTRDLLARELGLPMPGPQPGG